MSKKQIRNASKEGSKKSKDVLAMHETTGGLFYQITVENSLGRWDLIEHTMGSFNQGDGLKMSKALVSSNDDKVIIYIHVPTENETSEVTSLTWAQFILPVCGPNATLTHTDNFARIEIPLDSVNNIYPLKIRDTVMNTGFSFLRKHQLIVDEPEDVEDYVGWAENVGIEW